MEELFCPTRLDGKKRSYGYGGRSALTDRKGVSVHASTPRCTQASGGDGDKTITYHISMSTQNNTKQKRRVLEYDSDSAVHHANTHTHTFLLFQVFPTFWRFDSILFRVSLPAPY
jgi:hypothetical protein